MQYPGGWNAGLFQQPISRYLRRQMLSRPEALVKQLSHHRLAAPPAQQHGPLPRHKPQQVRAFQKIIPFPV
jgi:hypothetical protein